MKSRLSFLVPPPLQRLLAEVPQAHRVEIAGRELLLTQRDQLVVGDAPQLLAQSLDEESGKPDGVLVGAWADGEGAGMKLLDVANGENVVCGRSAWVHVYEPKSRGMLLKPVEACSPLEFSVSTAGPQLRVASRLCQKGWKHEDRLDSQPSQSDSSAIWGKKHLQLGSSRKSPVVEASEIRRFEVLIYRVETQL